MDSKFDWDDGNKQKSHLKHGIHNSEAESCFSHDQAVNYLSEKQYGTEIRYIRVGKTSRGKLITNVFTFRDDKIRIISSRPANAKEKRKYHEKFPIAPSF